MFRLAFVSGIILLASFFVYNEGFAEKAEASESKTNIPEWIKQVAEFWIAEKIDDASFVQVIEYLVEQNIIAIPYAEAPEGDAAASIPSWIKTNTEFWVKGNISDDEFAIGLEWLINNGIIKIKDQSERIVPAFEIEGNLFPTYQFAFTPNSPDCPDFHLHATSGYTVDAVLVSFTDHDPGGCGLGIAKEIPTQDVSMTEGQILEWEKVSGVKIPEE